MTDRPRTWTHYACPQCGTVEYEIPRCGCFGAVERIQAVEWDRGRVVPIIEQALSEQFATKPGDFAYGQIEAAAEAVFDALNGEQG